MAESRIFVDADADNKDDDVANPSPAYHDVYPLWPELILFLLCGGTTGAQAQKEAKMEGLEDERRQGQFLPPCFFSLCLSVALDLLRTEN